MSNKAKAIGAFLPKLMGGVLRMGAEVGKGFVEQAKTELSEKAALEAKKLQLTTIILQNPDINSEINQLANKALLAIEQRICIIESKKLAKETNANKLLDDILKGV